MPPSSPASARPRSGSRSANSGLCLRHRLAALGRLEQAVSTGGDPVGPMAHGALKVVAGLLLLMPGFLTDALGLALLVPAVRRALVRRGAARVTVRATSYARAHRPGGGSAR